MIVTLTANPSIDRTLWLPALRRGCVHRARSVSVEPSGKGVNVARALAGNGYPATAVLPLGGPEGERLAHLLREEKLPFVAVPVAAPIRSNVTLLEAGGVATKVNEPGPRLSPDETAALLAAVLRESGAGVWTVCCGSLPPGVPDDFYAAVVTGVHRRGGRVAVDSGGSSLRLAAMAGADLLKPNRDELAEATGRPVATIGDAVDAARHLLRWGAGAVLASLGPDGAVLASHGPDGQVPDDHGAVLASHGPDGQVLASLGPDGTGPEREAPVVTYGETGPVTLVSPVGAGDALLAGFLAARTADRGAVDAAALRTGLAWAAACCGTADCTVPAVGVDEGAAAVTGTPDLGRRLASA